MSEGFGNVAHIGLATGLVIGGAAGAYARGVGRARAYQAAADAGAVRDDEVRAFDKLASAFRSERVRAETAEAKVAKLEAEIATLRAERIRMLMRQ